MGTTEIILLVFALGAGIAIARMKNSLSKKDGRREDNEPPFDPSPGYASFKDEHENAGPVDITTKHR